MELWMRLQNHCYIDNFLALLALYCQVLLSNKSAEAAIQIIFVKIIPNFKWNAQLFELVSAVPTYFLYSHDILVIRRKTAGISIHGGMIHSLNNMASPFHPPPPDKRNHSQIWASVFNRNSTHNGQCNCNKIYLRLLTLKNEWKHISNERNIYKDPIFYFCIPANPETSEIGTNGRKLSQNRDIPEFDIHY